MVRCLIEVPHEVTPLECARHIKILLETGSHYLTHADFGCQDGEHKAWVVVEAEGKDEAVRMLPPAFRTQAKVVRLTKFTLEEIDRILSGHSGPRA